MPTKPPTPKATLLGKRPPLSRAAPAPRLAWILLPTLLGATTLATPHAAYPQANPTAISSPAPTPDPLEGKSGTGTLETRISVVGDSLALSCSLGPVLLKALKPLLSDGLTHRVTAQLSLVALPVNGESHLISVTRRHCAMVFDLWTEQFATRLDDQGNKSSLVFALDLKAATDHCGEIDRIALAPLERVVLGVKHRVELLLVIDPKKASQDLISKQRETNPFGGASATRPGGTFFGAMARAFYTEPDRQARLTLELRSAPFDDALIAAALRARIDSEPDESEEGPMDSVIDAASPLIDDPNGSPPSVAK